ENVCAATEVQSCPGPDLECPGADATADEAQRAGLDRHGTTVMETAAQRRHSLRRRAKQAGIVPSRPGRLGVESYAVEHGEFGPGRGGAGGAVAPEKAPRACPGRAGRVLEGPAVERLRRRAFEPQSAVGDGRSRTALRAAPPEQRAVDSQVAATA